MCSYSLRGLLHSISDNKNPEVSSLVCKCGESCTTPRQQKSLEISPANQPSWLLIYPWHLSLAEFWLSESFLLGWKLIKLSSLFSIHIHLNLIPFSGDSVDSWLSCFTPLLAVTAFLGALFQARYEPSRLSSWILALSSHRVHMLHFHHYGCFKKGCMTLWPVNPPPQNLSEFF